MAGNAQSSHSKLVPAGLSDGRHTLCSERSGSLHMQPPKFAKNAHSQLLFAHTQSGTTVRTNNGRTEPSSVQTNPKHPQTLLNDKKKKKKKKKYTKKKKKKNQSCCTVLGPYLHLWCNMGLDRSADHASVPNLSGQLKRCLKLDCEFVIWYEKPYLSHAESLDFGFRFLWGPFTGACRQLYTLSFYCFQIVSFFQNT